MKRHIKTAVAITTLAVTATASVHTEACDRGGRRSFFSGTRYSAPAPTYRNYSQPVYHQPQVVYQQPVQTLPPTRVVTQRPPVAPSQLQPQLRPQGHAQFQQQSQPQFQQQSQPQFQQQGQPQLRQQGQPQLQQQGQPQLQQQGQPQLQQQGQPQLRQQVAPQNQVRNQVQPATQNRVQPQQQSGRTAPTQRAAAPAARSQAQVTPAATQQRAATQPSTQPTAQQNAESSALQMLAAVSMATTTTTTPKPATEQVAATTGQIPQFEPAAGAVAAAEHVGTWRVSLPGSQSVELILEGNGNFSWTATKNNASNNFKGQYRLENGRLTLVRSTDLQQMAGSWNGSGQGFTFKLDGATTGGLAFSRS